MEFYVVAAFTVMVMIVFGKVLGVGVEVSFKSPIIRRYMSVIFKVVVVLSWVVSSFYIAKWLYKIVS